MSGNDMQTVENFPDRLRQAALYRRVDYSPTVIGRSLGIAKQTVHRWMAGTSIPSPENIFLIADLWQVNARWLATGEGNMLSVPENVALTKQESELVNAYRSAAPDGKNSLRSLARVVGRGVFAMMLALILTQPEPAQAGFSTKGVFAVYYVKWLLSRLRQYFAMSYRGN